MSRARNRDAPDRPTVESPTAPDDAYFSKIEEHFGRRRGGPLVLSPKDWQLVDKWHRQGIPTGVVLRGINHAFDRFAAAGPRPDKINSLAFCAQEVEAAWAAHREARPRQANRETGGDAVGLPGATPHLSALAAACRAASRGGFGPAFGDALGDAADQLEALADAAGKGALDARALDEQATALQRTLEAKLRGDDRNLRLEDLGLAPFSPYDV